MDVSRLALLLFLLPQISAITSHLPQIIDALDPFQMQDDPGLQTIHVSYLTRKGIPGDIVMASSIIFQLKDPPELLNNSTFLI